MLTILTLTFLIILGISILMTLSAYLSAFFGSMWVPTSQKTVQQMLTLANLQPGQTLVDLGAGDGRVVILAARTFGATAVGVEIDPLRCLLANLLILGLGLRGQATVYYGNVFKFDMPQPDVVFIYLTRESNRRLKPRLARLRPGTKIVSRFAIPGWNALAVSDTAMIFLYEVGNTGPQVKTRLI